MRNKKIDYLIETNGTTYKVCKYKEFIQIPENIEGSGYNHCSIKYIGFGRYLIGFYDFFKTGKYLSSSGQDKINSYKILFSNSISLIQFKQ